MGCCSSREASSLPADDGHPSSAASQPRLALNGAATSQTAVSQTPLSQSTNQIHSPATSRAALNPISSTSLQSGSAVSSPRQPTNRHRHRGTTDAASSSLTTHYNLPLQIPKAWKSKSRTWTPSQLRRERQDFFDTRVTGHNEVWEAIRQVTECVQEGDVATAQGILNAVNVTLPTGHLEDGCYDERGFLYTLPEEVLSDPTNLQSDDSEVDGKTVVGIPADGKAKLSNDSLVEQSTSLPTAMLEKQETSTIDKAKDTIPQDAIHLKCRLSDRGMDVTTYIGRAEKMAVLAARIQHLAQIPAYARVEIFYLGKKLDQKKTIEEQAFVENHVLNIFVVGAPK